MTRMSYRTALRAKGIRPLPKTSFRSSTTTPVDANGERIETICATTSALRERISA